MVATRKVDQKGRVVVPEKVIREIGGKPGDTVTFRATRRGTVELTVTGTGSATTIAPGGVASDEVPEPSRSDKQPGIEGHREGEEELVPMTLAEMIERFPIEGPIDEADLREGWHDDAARDAMKGMEW